MEPSDGKTDTLRKSKTSSNVVIGAHLFRHRAISDCLRGFADFVLDE